MTSKIGLNRVNYLDSNATELPLAASETEAGDFITSLPSEIQNHIASFLDFKSLGRLSCVSSTCRAITNERLRQLSIKTFGLTPGNPSIFKRLHQKEYGMTVWEHPVIQSTERNGEILSLHRDEEQYHITLYNSDGAKGDSLGIGEEEPENFTHSDDSFYLLYDDRLEKVDRKTGEVEHTQDGIRDFQEIVYANGAVYCASSLTGEVFSMASDYTITSFDLHYNEERKPCAVQLVNGADNAEYFEGIQLCVDGPLIITGCAGGHLTIRNTRAQATTRITLNREHPFPIDKIVITKYAIIVLSGRENPGVTPYNSSPVTVIDKKTLELSYLFEGYYPRKGSLCAMGNGAIAIQDTYDSVFMASLGEKTPIRQIFEGRYTEPMSEQTLINSTLYNEEPFHPLFWNNGRLIVPGYASLNFGEDPNPLKIQDCIKQSPNLVFFLSRDVREQLYHSIAEAASKQTGENDIEALADGLYRDSLPSGLGLDNVRADKEPITQTGINEWAKAEVLRRIEKEKPWQEDAIKGGLDPGVIAQLRITEQELRIKEAMRRIEQKQPWKGYAIERGLDEAVIARLHAVETSMRAEQARQAALARAQAIEATRRRDAEHDKLANLLGMIAKRI